MKTLIALSSFIAIGASVTGAGALALKGSDTLEAVTVSVLSGNPGAVDCGQATLTYAGTGSGNGETALTTNAQEIAPMSRQLKASVCAANPNYRLNAIALDGIAILQSRREGTLGVPNSALNAVPNTIPSQKTCLGVKFVAGAPFARIRSLFGGGDGSPGSVAAPLGANGSVSSCTNAFRSSTINNWTNFTSSTCARAGNKIRHAFRRDDASGTTDAFKAITGVTGFCNGLTGQDNDPIRVTCDADEQVCGPDGKLGVVLPISVPATNAYPGAGTPTGTPATRWSAGEFHRLHQSQTMSRDPNTGLDVTPCRRPDATQQIGCLVSVSPYSVGFAGLEGTTVSNATSLKVGNVVPRTDTIRAGTYPMTRKLYVNNLDGNAAVAGVDADQGKLLACFLDRTYTDPKVTAAGFITFSDVPTDGAEAAFQSQTCF
jgi:ABC-type phosphate transport system substrate-binding protein